MQRIVIYITVILLFACVACSRRPSHVIAEKKMTDVLYDIQLAQAIFRANPEFSSDDKKDAVIEGILNKHKITQAELDSSLVWYADNIKIYVAINDVVGKRLKADYDTLEVRRLTRMKNVRDWSDYVIPPFFYLTDYSPAISFEIDSVKMRTMDMDNFNITFGVHGLKKNDAIEASLYFIYKDTTVNKVYWIEENARFALMKPELPDSLLKEFSGYIRMEDYLTGSSPKVLFYDVSYSDSLSNDNEGRNFKYPEEISYGSKPSTKIQSSKDIKTSKEKVSDDSVLDEDKTPLLKRKLQKDPLTRRRGNSYRSGQN